MVKTREVKLVMSPGELTIRIEKRWIARDGLVQQIDCLTEIRHPAAEGCPRKHMTGARIEIESDEIAGRPALNRQSLSSRDPAAKPLSDFSRNLAPDGEQIVQIAEPRFQLLRAAGEIRCSKSSRPMGRPARATLLPSRRH